MFNSLTGTITEKLPQKVHIETHGIEWDVFVPETTLAELPPVGQTGKVYTWLQHTDVLMVLYGFASDSERNLFFDLLKVDGIGPKGALKIMSNVSEKELVSVLDSGDVGALEKIPGVGKKTAGKMLLQLKGKLTLGKDTVVVKKNSSVPFANVVAALVDMGYDKNEAEQTVAEICGKLENDDSYKNGTSSQKEDIVFRKAIVELA